MPSAGGHVPTQTVAPASASDLAMAKPKPPSSATPATKARLPERSIDSICLAPTIGEMARESRPSERGEQRFDFLGRAARDADGVAQFGRVEIPNEYASRLEHPLDSTEIFSRPPRQDEIRLAGEDFEAGASQAGAEDGARGAHARSAFLHVAVVLERRGGGD